MVLLLLYYGGTPKGIRTPVAALKGLSPSPLDDRGTLFVTFCLIETSISAKRSDTLQWTNAVSFTTDFSIIQNFKECVKLQLI